MCMRLQLSKMGWVFLKLQTLGNFGHANSALQNHKEMTESIQKSHKMSKVTLSAIQAQLNE